LRFPDAFLGGLEIDVHELPKLSHEHIAQYCPKLIQEGAFALQHRNYVQSFGLGGAWHCSRIVAFWKNVIVLLSGIPNSRFSNPGI
jgi:hypothetical protein